MGRLKLRIFNDRSAELIFYRRPNKKGSRYSEYYILPSTQPILLDEFFAKAFGRIVIVQKERHLFLYKNARIHLDKVRGLGTFIEFEVLVKKGKPQARHLFDFLFKTFSIKQSGICASSYADLLLRRR